MKQYFIGLKSPIEAKFGQSLHTFEPVQYTSQVVAGTNYNVVIKVGPGASDYLHAKIFSPLPHTGQ